jgi:hypothetical protein
MREVLILLLIAAAGYLAYDDFYKQRAALRQAQAEIQQLSSHPVNIRAIRGIRGRQLPYQLVRSLTTPAREQRRRAFHRLSFFGNFAPPFPEKEVSDESAQESQK